VEVVIDAQLYSELSTAASKDKTMKPFVTLASLPLLSASEIRAVLLIKLVQMLKLKKNCSKASADFMISLLNSETSATKVSLYSDPIGIFLRLV
jgi:hypothetical protein